MPRKGRAGDAADRLDDRRRDGREPRPDPNKFTPLPRGFLPYGNVLRRFLT